MTQSTPPPSDGNPFAQQPAAGNPYAQQPADGNPYAQQPGAALPPPAPFAPAAAPARNNLALGLVAAVVVALVTAGIYGGIVGATKYEIGYAAVGVGFLIGFAAGKIGGTNPVLPVVSALLSLGAVYLGQLIGIAMMFADELGVSATTMLVEHVDVLTEYWGETAGAMTFLFLAIGAFAAFSGAKKAAR
ncbi:hypothetical protein [Streptomyces europaeiscabiei]|uniref:hypothetical protein n=1 Tax=Streptomyces europaeiscabiei TaxID=146819 RepID=UPI0029B46B13|nr:hypothetical protein [Streptomyces europaeiscabiei]MDX3612549.1 hypothetical protein [Streptomyces europaeiscabiei]WUD37737.1 hypothetical protein OG858_44235 [Streptomyces europaeiscabiei]